LDGGARVPAYLGFVDSNVFGFWCLKLEEKTVEKMWGKCGIKVKKEKKK